MKLNRIVSIIARYCRFFSQTARQVSQKLWDKDHFRGFLSQKLRDTTTTLIPKHQHYLKSAQGNLDRALQLVNTILDINHLESGEIPLVYTTFQLAELVTEVVTMQNPLATHKKIQISSNIPPETPTVRADRDLIDRVLRNLLGNAVKFTPQGGTVSVIAAVDKGNQVFVSIQDTGTGIPQEIQDRLFGKFVVGNQKERGSGLGLAFCKMVVEAHGQQIWVDKTSDKGTTITFSLPGL